MSYKEQMQAAESAGQVRDISFNIFKFEDIGDTVCGEMIGFGKIKIANPDSSKEDNEVMQYRIMTDDGPVCVVLGVSGDKAIIDNNVVNGDILSIVFQGQKELEKGRRVNLFSIKVFKKESNK